MRSRCVPRVSQQQEKANLEAMSDCGEERLTVFANSVAPKRAHGAYSVHPSPKATGGPLGRVVADVLQVFG